MQSPWDLETEYASHFNEKMELKFVNSLQRMIGLMDDQIMERINAFFYNKIFKSPVARAKEKLVNFRRMYDEKDGKPVVISTPALEFFLDKKFIVANNMAGNYSKMLIASLRHFNQVQVLLEQMSKNIDRALAEKSQALVKMKLEMSNILEEANKDNLGIVLTKKSLISKEEESLQLKQLRQIILKENTLNKNILECKNRLQIQMKETQLLQKNLIEKFFLDYVQKVENSLNRANNNFKQIDSSAILLENQYSAALRKFKEFSNSLKPLTGNEQGVFVSMENFFGQIFFYLFDVGKFTIALKDLTDFYQSEFVESFKNFCEKVIATRDIVGLKNLNKVDAPDSTNMVKL